MPGGPTAVALSQSELATQAAMDQAIAQTAEAQSLAVQQTLQAQNNSGGLVISDVQVSTNTFYYLNNTCGPTEVTISAKVTSSVAVTSVGVLRNFHFDNGGYNGGRADAMAPIGNDRYALTIPTPDYDNKNINQENYSLELIFYAEDAAGNQVATGEWGDGVGDGHLWPPNPVQIQIPTLSMLPCHATVSQTEAVQVNMPTFTPTPYLELPTNTPQPLPTSTPAPSVQARSNYVELGDWYATNETADMDFSGANELAFMAATSDYPDHSLGQNVSQGEGIMMARTSSPSYETCRAVGAWYPGIAPVNEGETYCYLTAGGTYGYFRIDKIENRGSEIAQWIIGLSYTVWIP